MIKQSKQRKTPGRIVRTAENIFHNPELHDRTVDEWINPVAYAKRTPASGKHRPTAKEMQLDMSIENEAIARTKKAPSRLRRAATRLKKEVGTVGRGVDAMWSDPEQHEAIMAVWGGPATGARRTPPLDEPGPQAVPGRSQEAMPHNVVLNIGVPVPEVGEAASPPTAPKAQRKEPTINDILPSPDDW